MKSPFKPLGSIIIAKLDEPKKQTPGGLNFIEDSQEKPHSAEVIAVGEDVKKIKVGDWVVYRPYSMLEVGDYVLLEEEDVLATVN